MRVLVLNAGSSTIKWSVLETGNAATVVDAGDNEWASSDLSRRSEQIRAIVRRSPGLGAVGHRVVHGGVRFTGPTIIDAAARAALEGLVDLDPLHMGSAIAGIDAVTVAAPAVPQVASFDTAFHAGMPAASATYPLPFDWSDRWQLRRFGFHGISVAYSVERIRAMLGRLPSRTLVCHLGSGCSITAVLDGRSVDTTMGFTPLEGVMMATRSGSIDPGLLLHLQRRAGIGPDELLETLDSRSGLLGVSGISGDLRRVLQAADQGSARARLAYDAFIWSVRRAVGAMAGVLGGAEVIVFTGGIGEHSDRVRADVAPALGSEGLMLDRPANLSGRGDRIVSSARSPVTAIVVEAREDLMILSDALRLLNPDGARDGGASPAPSVSTEP
jgi:acetate kinase